MMRSVDCCLIQHLHFILQYLVLLAEFVYKSLVETEDLSYHEANAENPRRIMSRLSLPLLRLINRVLVLLHVSHY